MELFIAAGKFSWICKQQDNIVAKGKGMFEMHWFTMCLCSHVKCSSDKSNGIDHSLENGLGEEDIDVERINKQTEHLVNWNCEGLLGLLRQVVAHCQARSGK